MTRASYKFEEVVTFRRIILSWYRTNGRYFPWRKKSATSYQKIISEVLLQRTRAETVAVFFSAFVRQFPSWRKLSKATEKRLQVYLQPIGLWRKRAETLKKLSHEMASRNGRFPKSREEIEKLSGVGQYIANSIELFCHGKPRPLLDSNMARVLERYFGPRKLADIRYDPYLQALAKKVVSCKDPAFLNWAILDHAALICKPSAPLHNHCPLVKKCRHFNHGIS